MVRARDLEERAYARLVAEARAVPAVDRDEERELAARARGGDRAAEARLVAAHLRHVIRLADQYRGYGLRTSELVGEGLVGLVEALRRFEPERELRFWTYAAYWVRAYMLAFVLKQWSIVGTGTGPMASRLFFRLSRERARLAAEGAEGPALDEELAEHFGAEVEHVRAMSDRLQQRDASLDAPVSPAGDTRAVDLMVDESADLERHVSDAERDRLVRARLGGVWPELDERERAIVNERLLGGDDGMTLQELGGKFGLSRERVRQLEARLLGKLRRALAPLQAA